MATTDPFIEKANRFEAKVKRLINSFQFNPSEERSCDTSLLYLLLHSNVDCTYDEISEILLLDMSNSTHQILFNNIKLLVHSVAKEIYFFTGLSSLCEISLTDIKETCYVLAASFKLVFFAPVIKKISCIRPPSIGSGTDTSMILEDTLTAMANGTSYDALVSLAGTLFTRAKSQDRNDTLVGSKGDSKDYEEVIYFVSLFNQMWIIALMLKKEYKTVVQENTYRR
ncbi:uncharacterized protein PRCAT00005912001 [Priceomyces carsonii]|uniref:uncharacterized protein n=1 Tax=Priceomyces carsonii TaxID=28549 RepID=UPI002ED826FD|nr:unnamed protein product [Priceomyces carsonii]